MDCRKSTPVTPLKELGQRVLEQGERPRLVTYIAHDPVHQSLFQQQSYPSRRPNDRQLELFRRQRQHKLGPLAHQVAKVDVLERKLWQR